MVYQCGQRLKIKVYNFLMSEMCLLDLINCMLDNQCLADYPRDGICYGNDEDGVPILKDLNQVNVLRKPT